MVALAHTRAPTLAFARVACAYAGAVAAALLLLLLAAPPAGATATSDRPLLSLDRSDISLSDAEWDDLQGTLRQRSDYSPVTLAAGGTDLVNPAPAANDKCGVAASAGDVNGDGRSDVVLGCAEDDSGATDAGTVVVFTRNAANTGFDAAVTLVNPAPAASDFCGNFVSTTDVNGDGRDDVVMTCVQDDLGAVDAGTVYVFTRNVGNTGFDAAVALANPAPATGDFCGTAAAGGDVNGDGFGDVVVGCPDDDTGAADTGSAVVFLRNATNTGFQAGTTIANPAPAASDACASDLAVGDTNGDGRADIAMGCWADDIGATNAGAVAIFTRNAANSGFDAAVQLANPAPVVNDDCGSAVFGDVNGDGRSDLLMGCTDDDAGANDSGAGYVFTRNAGNTGYDSGVLVVDPTPVAFDRCGFTATLGDINGDGNADVVLGCHWSGPGHVVLIARNATNTGFDAGVEITPTTPVAGDACGNGIATGDFDGDGRSDLLLGCPGDDAGASAAGAAHVRLSINNGVTGTLATTATAEGLPNASPAVSDYCGIWVASGDLNADGRDDVVLGCPNDDTGGTDAGNVTVLLRNAANTGFDPGIELANPTPVASDNCGRSVAVGDFNGDGRGDVAMGCKLDDTGATDTGNVVVYVRNAGNTGFTLAGELVNPAPGVSEWCGVALTAGDVNGDGRDDIVAGCQFESSGIGHEGAMIVFTRNAGNTAFNAGVKIINPTPVLSDYCGLSVTAGDLNADGRDDLIMGCPADDTASANAGNVAVYLRN
ncbi:MAG: hypothetical protein JWN72_2624, partial [Thermoleophilia bacterium]|nr:hypothetical protein [Thermoleophilia bacterium]